MPGHRRRRVTPHLSQQVPSGGKLRVQLHRLFQFSNRLGRLAFFLPSSFRSFSYAFLAFLGAPPPVYSLFGH